MADLLNDPAWGASMRQAYRKACHGAGAEPRREARDEIAKLLDAAGVDLGDAFRSLGLDLSAYFASRPI